MKFPWTVDKKNNTPADEKIEQIKALLFPPLKLEQELSNEGDLMKFHVDYSADSNLDAVLMDLQEGYNDEAAHKTLNDVIIRLNRVRRVLEAYAQIDPEAKYIIVDNMETTKDFIPTEE